MQDYISFPALGWQFPISDTVVQFELFGAPFTIKWYGVLIAVGFILAVIYATKRARSFDVDPDRLIDVVLVSTLFAFVGARLYYVLFSADRAAYFADPIKILRVQDGGLAIYGGIIMAFLTGLWMCRVRKVNTAAAFDLAALGFLIGQCIGRWGNFFNQEAYGMNTTLPWGMSGSKIAAGYYHNTGLTGFDPSLPVHPTFLYESLWCLLGFILLHMLSKKAYKFKGEIFSLYLVWYGAGRFFIEGLRTDSLYIGTMRVSQLVAVLTVLGGLVLFLILRARSRELPAVLFADNIAAETTENETAETAEGETAETAEGEETTFDLNSILQPEEETVAEEEGENDDGDQN